MMSFGGKRCLNVSENEDEYSSDDSDYNPNRKQLKKGNLKFSNKGNKRQKLFKCDYVSVDEMKQQKTFNNNRNALMARQNRIKKKMHLQNLEATLEKYKEENKKLSSILENQSSVICDLRKTVKYLKNVLINSSDLAQLLRNINQNIVSSSTPPTVNNDVREILTNSDEDTIFADLNGEFLTLSDWNLFSDAVLPNEIETNDDHSYNLPLNSHEQNDAGVCLHVKNQKVSLEFCSSCSENAANAFAQF